MFNKDKNNYLFLLVIFFSIFAIMLPFKDQVFSEDFAYAQSVRHFITTGDLKVSERVAPTSITHIVWGSAVSKIFGFSLANLHMSTVLLIPFLLIALYELFKLTGTTKEKSFIYTLFFLSIPWILQLSYTFMTDISFLLFEVFSLFFYLKGLKRGEPKSLIAGSIFASFAFLTRQLGIALPLAALITLTFDKKYAQQKFKYIILATAIPILTVALYLLWLSFPGNKTIAQYGVLQEYKRAYFNSLRLNFIIGNFATILHRTLNFVSQAQVLFFPIIALLFFTNRKKVLKIVGKNWSSFTISTLVAFAIYGLDVINFRKDYTVGFPLLIYQYESLIPIPWAHIWKYIVLISIPIISSTIYLQRNNIFKTSNFQRFIFLTFFFLAIPTVIHVASWDEYIIPFLPILMLWIATLTKKFALNAKFSLLVVLILILDSLQMTKLRYNESGLIWEKAMKLVNTGTSPTEIDANNNFGWYYWFYYEKLASDSIKSNVGDKEKSNYGFVITKPNFPKYRIYTPLMIGYSGLDTTNYKSQKIPARSLFVKSEIYFMQLNQDVK